MMRLILLLLFTFSIFANECEVEVYSQIIKINKTQGLLDKNIFKNQNCDEAILSHLLTLLNEKDGSITASDLENKLGKENIHIVPRKIQINLLSDLFKEHIAPNSSLVFVENQSMNGIKYIALNEGDKFQATCASCTTLGGKSVKLEIQNSKNEFRTLWFNTKIFTVAKVLKAKRNISFQEKSLKVEDFVLDEIVTMTPDNLLSSFENIQFYKSNKSILAGNVVTNMDLQPINLVSFGTPVQIELKNQNINLSKIAIPSRSAFFGETIEVKLNSKSIYGKVIDFNKVVIEL